METGTGIFETTAQAVHVAFLVMAQDARQDAPLRSALMRVMEGVKLSPRQLAWYQQLKGEAGGNIDFSGLSSAEVRAQCAMITQAVRTKLPDPERWALLARYGQTDFEDVGGKRRFAFSVERTEAIQSLGDYLALRVPGVKRMAVDCLLARLYATHSKTRITLEQIAESFDGNPKRKMFYSRASRLLRDSLEELENMALDRLAPHFVDQGVVSTLAQAA